jgi:hypothetical protein
MSRCRTCVLVVALALCATPSYAGYLAGDTSAYAGWHGTSAFDDGADLKGTVDYAVYSPGNWPASFDFGTFVLDTNQVLYTYQIFSDGDDPVTLDFTPIAGPGQDIGWFTGTGVSSSVDGETPTFFQISSFSFAFWTFSGLTTGETSKGLMFTSPNAPVFTSATMQDGGSTAVAMDIPGPGEELIPEPGTLTLAFCGLVGLGFVLLRRRGRRVRA